jgi:hypothetical protein
MDGITEAPVCNGCRRVPLSHLVLDVDEPIQGWESFFAERKIRRHGRPSGTPQRGAICPGDLIDEQREREARLAEETAARQAPVVTPHGIPARGDLSACEVMMSAGGMSPQEEFGRIPLSGFPREAHEEGSRHQAAERGAIRARKEQAR